MSDPIAGEFVKVLLPGESPWVEVIENLDENSFRGRIDNKIAGDYTPKEFSSIINHLMDTDYQFDGKDRRLHNFKYNQEIIFQRKSDGWKPQTEH